MSLRDRFFADPFTVEDDGEEHDDSKLKQPPATRKELWSYYLYYNGDNGYTMFSYIPNILQYLAYRGGFNPETPDVRGCDLQNTMAPCNVSWIGGSSVPVSSMMLYVQAISFSIQFLLFTTFGSLADYGRWNRYILLLATVIGCASQILPIVLVNDDGSGWGGMMAINIVALISYGTSLVFYAAAFPVLSDNLPAVRHAITDPKLTQEQMLKVSEKWRNHISAWSTTFSNIGFLIMTGVLSGASFYPWTNGDVLGNDPLYNFIGTVVCGGYWALNALPYFMFQPRGRSGPPLPDSANHITIGWKSIFTALKEIRKLKYLFLYIFSYFMFSDAVSTTNQMIAILQGEITQFSAQQITIMNLASAITSIIGCLGFLWVSKTFGVRTKTNLLIILFLSGLVSVWGCFGIGLDNFGIKNTWELWVFYVWTGLFTAPIWAWQQTMLAELVPKGKENLFFGLFGVVNKASSWIGPVVIGAITEHTSSLWKGWPFVLALFFIAFVLVCFIDVEKAKKQVEEYQKAHPMPDYGNVYGSHHNGDANHSMLENASLPAEDSVKYTV
ncbi:autophagy-related protein 22-like protein [Zychaea mexicana]|uniref:autophagy-related protein 22-like protein n=1 Tax=Zychaea mexicana TaxID=64656 RepID=UPI0022FEEE80|nr:autophagy-related protein 22-like protein [Zychaea mexicana]KAI9499724.1 autophagy-related protein 22-like protein [Zychaea mexicana]